MSSLSFLDLILFLGISQGIFLSISLQLIHDRNKAANKILSLLLLIAAVMLFGRVAAFRIPEAWVWRFGIFIDTTIFLFGPLLYLYVRRLLFSERPSFLLKWFHYVPAALHFCYYIATLTIPVKGFNELYFSGKLNLMFFIVEALGLLSFIGYWFKLFSLVNAYNAKEESEFSFKQSVQTFVKFLIGVLALFIVLWSISFTSAHFFYTPFGYFSYEIMWISIPVFVYVIGYFSLRQPAIFRIPDKPKSKSDKQRLKPDEIQTLQKRLKYYIVEEKVYLQSDITLKVLADKLETSSNNLSWLLNQVYQTSFYDYINEHRIQEFLKKIDHEEHSNHTFLALAMDVGFNSKSTFNRVFKSVMGTTPRNYLKDKNVA